MVIFHSYGSLPEGNVECQTSTCDLDSSSNHSNPWMGNHPHGDQKTPALHSQIYLVTSKKSHLLLAKMACWKIILIIAAYSYSHVLGCGESHSAPSHRG